MRLCYALLLVIGLMVMACEESPASLTEEAKEQMYGFHCLSAWDGNNDELEALVRARLNDPGSMETFETRMGPLADGRHRIVMDFGARNAFGGMVRHTAYGWIDNVTCEATLASIE